MNMGQRRFIVRGDNLAAWTAAAALVAEIGTAAEILIIADALKEPILSSASHAVIDSDMVFLSNISKTAEELLLICNGGFSLGTCLDGWPHSGKQVFHAPGEVLPPIAGFLPHQIVRYLSQARGQTEFFSQMHAPLRFQARAAAAGKFTPPADDRQSPRSLLRPAMQIDGSRLMQLMREVALNGGARLLSAQDAEGIEALLTIDCGPRSAENEDWQGLKNQFGYDRCLTARCSIQHDFPPYSIARAVDNGLLNILPLHGEMIVSFCYDSAATHADAARASLASYMPNVEFTGETDEACAPGYLSNPWNGRTIKLGTQAAQLGALYGSDVMLISMQIKRLLQLLPQGLDDLAAAAAEYNRLFNIDFQQLSDFVRLPFVCNTIAGPHWETLRKQPLPPTLERRLSQFKSRGRVVTFDGEIYESQVWSDMMIALGVIPSRSDPSVSAANLDKLTDQLGNMAKAFDQTIAAMPKHNEFFKMFLAQSQQ